MLAAMSFIDYFRAAFDLAKKAQSVELQSELLAMREDYNMLQEENTALKQQVRALQEQHQIQGALTYRAPAYYHQTERGKEDGPYCQRCWDVDRRLVRVKILDTHGGLQPICPQCQVEHSRRRS
jgi:hypothetical protein